MKPGLIYSAAWQTFQGDLVEVRISDRTIQIEDVATPQMVVLQASGDPLHIKVIDNNENPLNVFRAKQAIFGFQSQPGLSAGTFADGPDDRYSFTAILNPTGGNPQTIFDGFLVTSDLSQPFQPDSQVVTLTASDHLGLLKEIDITTDAGTQFVGKFKLIQFIAAILKKTGLSLPIKVINNVKVGGGSITGSASFIGPNIFVVTPDNFYYKGMRIRVSGSASNDGEYTVIGAAVVGAPFAPLQFLVVQNGPTVVNESAPSVLIEDLTSAKHLYDAVYVDTLLFEQGIGSKVDGYEGLTKIFKENVSVAEVKGEWWIYAVDEYDREELYVASFDADGVYIGVETTTALNKQLGAEKPHQFALADTELRYQRPHNFAKETYRFEYPEELPCNSDFSRGDELASLPTETIDGVTYTAKSFAIDCWEYGLHRPFTESPDPVSGQAYIKRLFYNDNERERYLEMTGFSYSNTNYIPSIKSQPIPVNSNDKIILGISTRLDEPQFQDGTTIRQLGARLVGNDGSYWYLSTLDKSWKPYPAIDYVVMISDNWAGYDLQQWNSFSYEAKPFPVSGDLYIYIAYDPREETTYVRHSDFNLEYLMFINGSYRKYTGQSYTVKRPPTEPGYLARKEEDVFIGNPPAPVIKGAMFIRTDGRDWMVDRFYKAHRTGLGPAPAGALNTFGFHQAYAAWNLVRNTVRIFAGTVFGMREDWPDIIHKYQLTDANGNTNGRYFILTSLDQNWRSCQMAATFIEVFVTDGKKYDDPYTLNYTTA